MIFKTSAKIATMMISFICGSIFAEEYPQMLTYENIPETHLDEFQKKCKLNISLMGGDVNENPHNKPIQRFCTKEKLTIDSARKLLINCIFDLFGEMCYEEGFDSLLEPSPLEQPLLPLNKINCTIVVRDDQGLLPVFPNGLNEKNEISYVSFTDGEIIYYLDIDKTKLPITIFEETVTEALEKIKKEIDIFYPSACSE